MIIKPHTNILLVHHNSGEIFICGVTPIHCRQAFSIPNLPASIIGRYSKSNLSNNSSSIINKGAVPCSSGYFIFFLLAPGGYP